MNTANIKYALRIRKNGMLWFVLLSALGAYVWRSFCPLHPYIQCFIKNPVSKSACAQLKAYMTVQQSLAIEPNKYIANLQEHFPWVKEITILKKPNLFSLTITPYKPFALLNKNIVLTKEGKIFSPDIFTPQELASLPTMTVDEKVFECQRTLKDIASFIEQLPQETFNFYTISWHNHHAIYCTDTINSYFTIITRSDKPLSRDYLYTGLQIKKKICTQLLKKVTEKWFADLRFGQHIIIKKGDTYGTHVS